METTHDQWEHLAEIQLHQLHARLDAMHMQQQRVTEMAWRSEGMPVTALERQEGDEGWYDMQDDHGEADVAEMLTQMEHHLDHLQHQEEAHGHHHDQGMGYSVP